MGEMKKNIMCELNSPIAHPPPSPPLPRPRTFEPVSAGQVARDLAAVAPCCVLLPPPAAKELLTEVAARSSEVPADSSTPTENQKIQ